LLVDGTGSGSVAEAESVQINYESGCGSGRPKNIRTLRIRNTARKGPERRSNSPGVNPDSESQIPVLGLLRASSREDKAAGSPNGSKEGELASEGGGGSSDAVTSSTRLPLAGGKRSSGGGGRSAEASRMRLPFGVGNGGGSGVGRVGKGAPPVGVDAGSGVVAASRSSDGGKMSLLSAERSSSAGGAPPTRSAAGVLDS
jgi:hypothetical protein